MLIRSTVSSAVTDAVKSTITRGTVVSYLETVADGMSSGTTEVLTTGFTEAQIEDGGISTITWSNSMGWNSARKQVQFVCKRASTYNHRFFTYDLNTNTWSYVTDTVEFGTTGHGYDGNTSDTAGNHYFQPYNSRTIKKFDGSSWSSLTQNPFTQTITQSLAWVKSNSLGAGLLLMGADGRGVAHWNGSAWNYFAPPATYATNATYWGTYHQFIEYNENGHVCIMGGGNNGGRVLYRMDSDLTFTLLTQPAFDMGMNQTLIVSSTVENEFIVYDFVGAGWHKFNAVTDTWTALTTTAPNLTPTTATGAMAVCLHEYGVILYLVATSGTPIVALYKP